ncbi:MAG TPA: hypothetical protein VFV79_05230 [Saprospiraceae bacterium]|nr:hypothetical protein [Saprospiraceae bacterium]
MKAANILENTRTGSLMDGYQNSRHSYCVRAVMRRLLTLLAFALLPLIASSQIGINARYQKGNSFYINQSGFYAGLEYYFRLKTHRVEFHPMLGYRRSFDTKPTVGYNSSIDFDINTAFYLFDFEGDCNCPTFSKQGKLVQKGFFFELQPGLGYQTIYVTEVDGGKSSNIVGKLGLAAGLDIGLSDQYTLTPFLSATRIFSGEWEVLRQYTGDGKMDDYLVYGFGVRFSHHTEESKRGHRY